MQVCHKIVNTIIVFGVSGVGKTTACLAFIERNPEFLYLHAGKLLAEAAGVEAGNLRKGGAAEVLASQNLLAEAVTSKKKLSGGRPIILDAHSIIDNDHELIQVPVEVVRALEPGGLIYLEASAEMVAERRKRDTRERPNRTIPELKRELQAAKEAVLWYAQSLSVPLVIREIDDRFRLEDALKSLMER